MSKRFQIWFCSLIAYGLLVISAIYCGHWLLAHKRDAGIAQCIENLEIIQHAKIEWMNEKHKGLSDAPTWDDIKEYIRFAPQPHETPICPEGGVYTIGRVGEFPKCSIGGSLHSLHPDAFPPPYHP